MLAKFDAFSARQRGADLPERRSVTRSDLRTGIGVRSMQGDLAAATVHDISPFGCSLVFGAEWRRMGMILRLTGTTDRSVDAVVRWLDETVCGVEFLRPLANPEAVLGGAD